MKKNKGFTLIELLVVIAIIGILSAIVLTNLSSARNKANDAKIQEQLHNVQSAMETYYSTNNNYQPSTGTTAACPTADTASGLATLFTASSWPGSTLPTCTTNSVNGTSAGTQWSAYLALSTGSSFCVDSTGQQKQEASGWTAPTTGAACP